MQEIQVPSLVREIRSHMLCRAAKRFLKKKKNWGISSSLFYAGFHGRTEPHWTFYFTVGCPSTAATLGWGPLFSVARQSTALAVLLWSVHRLCLLPPPSGSFLRAEGAIFHLFYLRCSGQSGRLVSPGDGTARRAPPPLHTLTAPLLCLSPPQVELGPGHRGPLAGSLLRSPGHWKPEGIGPEWKHLEPLCSTESWWGPEMPWVPARDPAVSLAWALLWTGVDGRSKTDADSRRWNWPRILQILIEPLSGPPLRQVPGSLWQTNPGRCLFSKSLQKTNINQGTMLIKVWLQGPIRVSSGKCL